VRRHWLLASVEHLVDADQLKRVGMIESQRRIQGQVATLERRRYYLLSLNGGVEQFAAACRSHWGIKNQLHWSLDVAFHEDDSRIRTDHAPENMTLIRKIALNLLTKETSTKVGKKAKRLKAGWDNNYLAKVLTT
jgi:predicted transposase YbfD/YdcC